MKLLKKYRQNKLNRIKIVFGHFLSQLFSIQLSVIFIKKGLPIFSMFCFQIKFVLAYLIKLIRTMSFNRESESVQALSDPMPRIYSCFCGRVFTTYPGIYLHLKSKHTQLFDKYKKLKITRLFKKVNDEHGNPIYHLERLSEDQPSKVKEDLSFIKSSREVKREEQNVEQQHYIAKQKKTNIPKPNHGSRRKMMDGLLAPPLQDNQFEYEMQRNRFMTNPYAHMGMGMGLHHFASMFHNFPPPFPEFRMTTKKLMQKYLQQIQTNFKLQAKKYLYNLIVFIDTNYELAQDDRAKNRMFLSYCCDFDPQFIAPLVLSYLSLLQARKDEYEDVALKKDLDAEVSCIREFAKLLRITGLTHCEVNQQCVQIEKKIELERTQGQVLVECEQQSGQYKVSG